MTEPITYQSCYASDYYNKFIKFAFVHLSCLVIVLFDSLSTKVYNTLNTLRSFCIAFIHYNYIQAFVIFLGSLIETKFTYRPNLLETWLLVCTLVLIFPITWLMKWSLRILILKLDLLVVDHHMNIILNTSLTPRVLCLTKRRSCFYRKEGICLKSWKWIGLMKIWWLD